VKSIISYTSSKNCGHYREDCETRQAVRLVAPGKERVVHRGSTNENSENQRQNQRESAAILPCNRRERMLFSATSKGL
jgi:hypothetical protein